MNDIKIIASQEINQEPINEIRNCGNCNKKFSYYQVKKKYPKACHKQLKKIWNDSTITFYCSSCYFIKLFKHLKIKKDAR